MYADISELCPHESPLHTPYCQNGGRLHAHAKYDYSSCSHCDCTEGWTGPDCSRAPLIHACYTCVSVRALPADAHACHLPLWLGNATCCMRGATVSSCAVCVSTSSCPDQHLDSGVVVSASACTHDSLEPQKGDARKRMGCFCGGVAGDVFSSYVCDTAQAHTHWMIDMIASENATDLTDGTPFNATIYERAGTPPSVRSSPSASE